ncbi:non-ribosomal peptide synthetase, partial [Xenorhabdus bovienii]|uniref:AMP-binding enzyme n=1 Tax=Xenorhabdus bovienii TaxID=40576 RepID=UPI003BADBC72|nr:non-ribosomal peptide synthetase [Xenorhabdus bovienii]
GLRIELGEIEEQIACDPAVNNAVVIAKDDQRGQKILLAYFTVTENLSESGEAAVTERVKQHLQQVLPDYMQPAGYKVLAVIPLSPNGKVNRKALPGIDLMVTGQAFEAPVTVTQKQLCEIWSGLLNLDKQRIGLNSHF